MFNPYLTRKITGTNAQHVARGSLGGTDYMALIGTPIICPAAGTVVLANRKGAGSGGKMVGVWHSPGLASEQLHLSSIIVNAGDKVREGQVLGYSGASGFGAARYYDPHIHAHFVRNNIRLGWDDYLKAFHPPTVAPAQVGQTRKIDMLKDCVMVQVSTGVYLWNTDTDTTEVVADASQVGILMGMGVGLTNIKNDEDFSYFRGKYRHVLKS